MQIMEDIFQLNSVGLLYDGFGVVILGYAFFSKTIKEMMVESGTYYGGNNALLNSLIHTRTDGVTGTTFLVVGFILQWTASVGIQCIVAGQILLAFLLASLIAYALLIRKYLIKKQTAKGIELREQRRDEK